MPGGFPIGPEISNGNAIGAATAQSGGTTLTPNASANTKGSWTQLVAATAADICYVRLTTQYFNSAASTSAVDFGIGAGGSEQVIIPNITCCTPNTTTAYGLTCVSFPLVIPAGTRIAARAQDHAPSTAFLVQAALIGWDGGFTQNEGNAGIDALGFVSGSTEGTAVTSSGSTNTKGSYAQIIAATTKDYVGFAASFDTQNTTVSSANVLLDIAVGGAGSEIVVVPNFNMATGNGVFPGQLDFMPIAIPAGTRIAARIQSSVATYKIGLTLYGVY